MVSGEDFPLNQCIEHRFTTKTYHMVEFWRFHCRSNGMFFILVWRTFWFEWPNSILLELSCSAWSRRCTSHSIASLTWESIIITVLSASICTTWLNNVDQTMQLISHSGSGSVESLWHMFRLYVRFEYEWRRSFFFLLVHVFYFSAG